MAEGTVVFVDYQNVYRRAREAFELEYAPHWEGQVDPLRLAHLVASRGQITRKLVGVRVYRGQPQKQGGALQHLVQLEPVTLRSALIAEGPAPVREALRAAWILHDAVQRHELRDHEFAHAAAIEKML